MSCYSPVVVLTLSHVRCSGLEGSLKCLHSFPPIFLPIGLSHVRESVTRRQVRSEKDEKKEKDGDSPQKSSANIKAEKDAKDKDGKGKDTKSPQKAESQKPDEKAKEKEAKAEKDKDAEKKEKKEKDEKDDDAEDDPGSPQKPLPLRNKAPSQVSRPNNTLVVFVSFWQLLMFATN